MAVNIFLRIALTHEQHCLIFDVALFGCGLDSHRVVALLPANKWDIISLQSIRIDFEAHPVSSSTGKVGCYRRRVVQSGRGVQLTTPLHLVPRLGISGVIFRYPIRSVSPDYYLMQNSHWPTWDHLGNCAWNSSVVYITHELPRDSLMHFKQLEV